MTLLEVQDLHAGYGKSQVLHGMSLTAGEGEITAVIGPNGAGKTTLAKAIAGVIRPQHGSVRLDGEPVDRSTPRQRAIAGLGYTPQGRNVFADLTVQENISVVVDSFAITADRVDEVLDQFPMLRDRRRQRAGTLSGGERQQLAIVCTQLSRPRLLVLDDPTTGLAPQVVAGLIEKIVDVKEQGAGIVWIIEEHPMHILPHCASVYMIDSGQIRHQATGPELVANPRFGEMFLGASVSEPGAGAENGVPAIGRDA
jgi:branched-chain amino acid transport system ATP-binding protein/neutral amino acid transport system ATP-binding protein